MAASIDYPCKLPGVLVNSSSYQSKNRVRRNDLASGPPLFMLEDDDGYVMFRVQWSFSAIEMQVFNAFYRHTLLSGSKSFNIGLMIDGDNGDSNTVSHQCYFDGSPSSRQAGRRWNVSATLLSISEEGLEECDSLSLVNAFGGFSYPLSEAVADVDLAIKLLEDLWLP